MNLATARWGPHTGYGHSKAEHKERIAELIAANEATAKSLFICIMQFGSRE